MATLIRHRPIQRGLPDKLQLRDHLLGETAQPETPEEAISSTCPVSYVMCSDGTMLRVDDPDLEATINACNKPRHP